MTVDERLKEIEKILNDLMLFQMQGAERRISHLEGENSKQWALFKHQSDQIELLRKEVKCIIA